MNKLSPASKLYPAGSRFFVREATRLPHLMHQSSAAVLVGGDGLAPHDPFQGGFAVGIIGLAEFHLGHAERGGLKESGSYCPVFLAVRVRFFCGKRGTIRSLLLNRHAGEALDGLVIQMPVGEIAAGLGGGAVGFENLPEGTHGSLGA